MRPGRSRLRRVACLAALVLVLTTCTRGDDGVNTTPSREMIPLPEPRPHSEMSLEEVLEARRSVRQFTSQRLTDVEISQLLWAAQGVTRGGRGRTAPSAGGLYPLEVYVVTADGVFHYDPAQHGLSMVSGEDLREALCRVALDQEAVRDAPAVFAVTAVVARTASKYGDRATRYVHLEAGHATQSLLLQAVALGLGGVPIGAFDDDGVRRVLGSTQGEEPVYLIPVGHPAE